MHRESTQNGGYGRSARCHRANVQYSARTHRLRVVTIFVCGLAPPPPPQWGVLVNHRGCCPCRGGPTTPAAATTHATTATAAAITATATAAAGVCAEQQFQGMLLVTASDVQHILSLLPAKTHGSEEAERCIVTARPPLRSFRHSSLPFCSFNGNDVGVVVVGGGWSVRLYFCGEGPVRSWPRSAGS